MLLCVSGHHLTSCSCLAEVVQLRAAFPCCASKPKYAQHDQNGHHEQHEQYWVRFQQAANKSQALKPEGAACDVNSLPKPKLFPCLTWHGTTANAVILMTCRGFSIPMLRCSGNAADATGLQNMLTRICESPNTGLKHCEVAKFPYCKVVHMVHAGRGSTYDLRGTCGMSASL